MGPYIISSFDILKDIGVEFTGNILWQGMNTSWNNHYQGGVNK